MGLAVRSGVGVPINRDIQVPVFHEGVFGGRRIILQLIVPAAVAIDLVGPFGPVNRIPLEIIFPNGHPLLAQGRETEF